MDYVDITASHINKQLKTLPNTVNTSPDGIPSIFLKKTADTISAPLCHIFCRSLVTGSVPEMWKKAIIRPIHKKGSKLKPSNYRPISLTCVTSKVLERLIAKRMRIHFALNSLFSQYQYGFLNRRSTTAVLLRTIQNWMCHIDNGGYVDCLYFDFRKAFDSVSHQKLFTKIKWYGIQGSLYNWLCDFLTNRSQAVKVDSYTCNYEPVSSGVPQGSVLGPLLFLIYINDLPLALPNNSKCFLFADDIKVFTNTNNLQTIVDSIDGWSKTWSLPLAADKTNLIRFGNKNPQNQVQINGISIQSVNSIRDLGVTVDERLNFHEHISNIVKKANSRSNLIIRAFSSRNLSLLTKLFTVYVRPVLEYASSVWSPCCPYRDSEYLNLIEGVQRRFTFRILKRHTGCRPPNYLERLNRLSLQTLELRRFYIDLEMIYSIVNNQIDLPFHEFFAYSKHAGRTRSRNACKLEIKRCHLDTVKYFFSNRFIAAWNNLPQDVAGAPSHMAFKTRLAQLPLQTIGFTSKIKP